MPDWDELRQALIFAEGARNAAHINNAAAANRGRAAPHSDEDLVVLRQRVDRAAMAARDAGCDVSDLVAPNVGPRDTPPA
jgi:hypothetical protein